MSAVIAPERRSVFSPYDEHLTAAETLAPTRGELWLIAVAAVTLRVVVFAIASKLHPWSLHQYAVLRDGGSYINIARGMLGDVKAIGTYDRRVFFGYPALIALVSLTRVAPDAVALGINWLSTGASAVLTAVLFRDRRLGWAMACLTPSYLMYSSMAMSEPTLLAMTLVGLVLVRRGREGAGGMALGYAGLIRPMACFAALGAVIERLERSGRRAVAVAATAALTVLVGFLAQQLWTGNALQGITVYAHDDRAYAGQLFALPLESLIMTPIRYPVPSWKVIYVWLTFLATVGGCWLLCREALRKSEQRELARMSAPWLVGNTLFTLFVGHIWGFHEYHRFILPALPPLLWAYRHAFPRRSLGWLPILAASTLLAIVGSLRSA